MGKEPLGIEQCLHGGVEFLSRPGHIHGIARARTTEIAPGAPVLCRRRRSTHGPQGTEVSDTVLHPDAGPLRIALRNAGP